MSLDKTKVCHELKVIDRIQETEDTISLVLEIPRTTGGKFMYKAGQFVTVFLDIQGEEVRRSYSLASSPEFETDFKITIKLVPGGKGSTYLINNVKVGDKLWVTPPAGHFCLPQTIHNQTLAFFAGGSGITPIISLIKSALKLHPNTRCVLLYQNRSEANIIFKKELTDLATKYASRLNIEFIFSKPSPSWTGLSGRIDQDKILGFFERQKLNQEALQFICGPEGFMNAVVSSLISKQVDKSRIFKESFTVAASPASPATPASLSEDNDLTLDSEAIVIGDKSKLSAPETIEASIEGQLHTVAYKKDKTILECLLDAELNPPYSCLDGACMACIAKVQDGVVYQNDMGILTDDNIEAGECLTCQARPASKNVKVTYEIF
ncbi:MAG: 2Fe-2S iron-sulfur cluster binding domain-containing protein [Bdellovibrionales bacterium]|nr:2Fe-2S iron-sulfur cluster binding domain-containing protein [Bdellovibrionales bacterium]